MQEDDEYDEDLELPPQTSNSHSLAPRPRRQATRTSTRNKSAVSYKEEKEDLEDEEVVIRIGGRVEAFIEERKELLDKIHAVSLTVPRRCRWSRSSSLASFICSGWSSYRKGPSSSSAEGQTRRNESSVCFFVRSPSSDVFPLQVSFDQITFVPLKLTTRSFSPQCRKPPLENSRLLSLRVRLSTRFLFHARETYQRFLLSFRSAYLLSSKKLSSITSTEQTLTDELWKSIQPKVLAAVDQEKQKQLVKVAKKKVFDRQESRQRSIRSYYDQLKASFDDSTFFPLFINFLHLPSVKPLWQDDEGNYSSIDDSSWKLLLPLIKNEIEEYHLDFISHAVRLILSTNNEYSSEEDLEDAVQATLEGDLDSFFSLASSLMMCAGGCRGEKQKTAFPRWNGRVIYKNKAQGGFLGTLNDVFSHLHQVHNDSSVVVKRQTTPRIPLCLPLHVASAISALIEVGRYSSDDARVKDLNLLNSGWFRFENSRSNRKNFNTWQQLVSFRLWSRPPSAHF